MNIRGKKLLVLGANVETIPIVRKAQEMGATAIVTDHILNSPAKLIADGYYNINGKDVRAIVDVIKKNDIDGVMVGVADPLISSYVKICEIMNFPCLIAADSIDFFSNKSVFKDECKKNGLPIVKEYFSCINIEQVNKDEIKFPMVVKPAVSRGGRGLSYCENSDELETAIIRARNNSDNLEVIGEEYIDSKDTVATFLCVNGRTYFLTLSDRVMLRSDNVLSTVTYSNIFPSLYYQVFKQNYLYKYSQLFKNLGIKNGIVNIQMFYKNGEFIPYDPDCIINGESASNLFNVILGVDIIGMYINYALTGNSDCLKYEENNCNVICGASVWILLKPGIIGKIEGKEEIVKKEYVIDSLWCLKEGFEVTDQMYHTEKSTLARIWIKASCKTMLDEEMAEVRRIIKVLDEEGNDMVEIL